MKGFLEAPVVFSVPGYEALAAHISQGLSAAMGSLEYKEFPDKERYLRSETPVRGVDVLLVGGTVSDRATLDMFDLANGFSLDGCRSLTLIVPYFGYSTMERAVRTGEVVTAKTRARLLSAIPVTPYGNQVLLLDLHSEGIPYYFETPMKAHHLYAKNVIIEEARKLAEGEFVLASVDAGRAKWVQSLANDMGVEACFVYKRRVSAERTEISGVNASVSGRHVIIYDDMIRTGGSVLNASRAYKEVGATRVSLVATHGVFAGNSLEKLKASGLIDSITCTDSHPNAEKQATDDFLKVVSIAPVFVQFLQNLRA